MTPSRQLAVVTGASSGIGFELAKLCAAHGCDLVVAADDPSVAEAAQVFRERSVHVDHAHVDLATADGVDQLADVIGNRPVDILCANAGQGLSKDFVEQDFDEIKRVIDTNITGTLDLMQRVVRQMRDRGEGRVLVTGSIAGLTPHAFQAVYGGAKAFMDMFTLALRNELKDTGVSVTLLMPGATDTEFFERAGVTDTKVGQDKKDDPAAVAQTDWDAMMRGEASVIHGIKYKAQMAVAAILPRTAVAEQARNLNQPRPGPDS